MVYNSINLLMKYTNTTNPHFDFGAISIKEHLWTKNITTPPEGRVRNAPPQRPPRVF